MSGGFGYYMVIKNGDLIYVDEINNVIIKIMFDYKIIEFIKMGNWEFISIYFFYINGDILVGMIKGRNVRVIRYNKKGEEI